jgi:pimeloyl-ACP methyl ester carboxylesterase
VTTVPWQDRNPTGKLRVFVWLLLLFPVLVALLFPFAQDYLRAASLLARVSNPRATGWIANYDVHAVEVHDTTFQFHGKVIPARVYLPQGFDSAPGIVVVHGMHELGIDEPRLVGFARSLAASGFFVMTPLVPGIADYRVHRESADVIGTAAQNFAQRIGTPKVGVLAISFSGGLALLAASDAQYSPSIAWVASVGGYYDLANVLRFFATGEAVRPDGVREHLSPHEYGPLIVVYDEPGDFFSAADAPIADEALKVLLAGSGKASESLTQKMTPAGQQTMQQIYHKERAGLMPAIMSEIDARRRQLAEASPAGHLGAIHVPVMLLHGSDDSVIPPTELLWLKRDIPQAYLAEALVSPAIGHVEVGSKIKLRDEFALIRWMAKMIREARNTEAGHRSNAVAGVFHLAW